MKFPLSDDRLRFEIEPIEEDKVVHAQNNLYQMQSENKDGDLSEYLLAIDRARRNVKPPNKFAHADLLVFVLTTTAEIEREDEPITFKEVINSKNFKKW